MLGYIHTNFHLEKDESTVPALLSEEARIPHKGNSCLAAEELWKPTIIYRVSIKSYPDYKHLLQENYVEYKHTRSFFTTH
jgi:hypothetical protein